MTTLTSAPIGSTGQLLDGVDVSGFFRESVAIGDANDRTKFAPVDSVVGLTVNVASTVPQTVNVSTSVTVTSFPAAVGQTTMASSVPVTIASDQSPVSINITSSLPLNLASLPAIGVSSIPAIGISSFANAIAVSSMPAIGVSSFATAIAISSMVAIGVSSFGTAIAITSIPAVGVSSHVAIGVSSIPAINVSSFAGAVGQTTMAFGIPVSIATNQTGIPVTQSGAPWGISAVGVSSMPVIGVSSMAGGALSIGVSSLPATLPAINISTVTAGTFPGLNVSSVTAATFPGLNISTFSAGSIGISSIPAVGVSSQVAIGVSSMPVITNVQVASSAGGGLSVSRIVQNLNTTNSTVAKAAAGQLYGWSISNTSTQCYMSLFNASSAVQISTAPLIAKIALQASSVANTMFPVPLTFSTGIYYALTALQVSGDNTVIAASTVTVNLYYA